MSDLSGRLWRRRILPIPPLSWIYRASWENAVGKEDSPRAESEEGEKKPRAGCSLRTNGTTQFGIGPVLWLAMAKRLPLLKDCIKRNVLLKKCWQVKFQPFFFFYCWNSQTLEQVAREETFGDWPWPWSTCLIKGVDLDSLQRSLPTSTIPWLCVSEIRINKVPSCLRVHIRKEAVTSPTEMWRSCQAPACHY